jgi:REP element-mobilizing transposase RayT
VCFPGAVYHVMARGNNRQPIFLEPADFQQFLRQLARYRERWQFRIHAYVLMPNHVHLLLEVNADATISRIMQIVTSMYARYFGAKHQKVGHVFQGRFRSRLVQTDTYLLAASRYIHLNPVKAGLCEDPLGYPWSSYGAYSNERHDPLQLSETGRILSMFGPERDAQRSMYKEFVQHSRRWDHGLEQAVESYVARGGKRGPKIVSETIVRKGL